MKRRHRGTKYHLYPCSRGSGGWLGQRPGYWVGVGEVMSRGHNQAVALIMVEVLKSYLIL
jgi:hypothetical protein